MLFGWARGRTQRVLSKLVRASSKEEGGKQPRVGDSAQAFPEG